MEGAKILLFLMCFNVLLYGLGFQLTSDDLISKLYDKASLEEGNIEYTDEIQNNFPQETKQGILETVGSFFADGLLIIWDLVKTIFNLLTSPVALFTNVLNPLIAIIIGIPISLAYLLTIIGFIRGAKL